MEWELAQVKRAVPAEAQAAPEAARKVYKPQPSMFSVLQGIILLTLSAVPTPASIPTLDASILRVDRLLSALNTSHIQSTTAIASLAEEHLKWDEEEVQLRRNVQEKEEMRAWFGAFQDRMEEVGEFLEEKVRFTSLLVRIEVFNPSFAVSGPRETRSRTCFATD
jgi:hypothetical protein